MTQYSNSEPTKLLSRSHKESETTLLGTWVPAGLILLSAIVLLIIGFFRSREQPEKKIRKAETDRLRVVPSELLTSKGSELTPTFDTPPAFSEKFSAGTPLYTPKPPPSYSEVAVSANSKGAREHHPNFIRKNIN